MLNHLPPELKLKSCLIEMCNTYLQKRMPAAWLELFRSAEVVAFFLKYLKAEDLPKVCVCGWVGVWERVCARHRTACRMRDSLSQSVPLAALGPARTHTHTFCTLSLSALARPPHLPFINTLTDTQAHAAFQTINAGNDTITPLLSTARSLLTAPLIDLKDLDIGDVAAVDKPWWHSRSAPRGAPSTRP